MNEPALNIENQTPALSPEAAIVLRHLLMHGSGIEWKAAKGLGIQELAPPINELEALGIVFVTVELRYPRYLGQPACGELTLAPDSRFLAISLLEQSSGMAYLDCNCTKLLALFAGGAKVHSHAAETAGVLKEFLAPAIDSLRAVGLRFEVIHKPARSGYDHNETPEFHLEENLRPLAKELLKANSPKAGA